MHSRLQICGFNDRFVYHFPNFNDIETEAFWSLSYYAKHLAQGTVATNVKIKEANPDVLSARQGGGDYEVTVCFGLRNRRSICRDVLMFQTT